MEQSELPQAVGFLSYAHYDNSLDDGLIVKIAQRITAEVRAQTGETFDLFIDRDDIKWGQTWRTRIEESVDASSFFFPILTPSYFKSTVCKEEAERFLSRENSLNRSDLVLPIYYIDLRGRSCNLADKFFSHQYLDWRELRFEPLTSPDVRRRIASAAKNICDCLLSEASDEADTDRSIDLNKSYNEMPVNHDLRGKESAFSHTIESTAVESRTQQITVGPDQTEDFNSIAEAIEKADAGTLILIKPGIYYESIKLRKSLELIGVGDRPDDVVVHSVNEPAIISYANLCRISNISFYVSPGESSPAGAFAQGKPLVEHCTFSSRAGDGLNIVNSDPLITNCSIHNCLEFGVVFDAQSRGTIENCEVYENELANICIKSNSTPMIRHNVVRNGRQSGIYVYDHGQGTIEDNDIHTNFHAGVAASHGGSPVIRGNRITRSMLYGAVYIFRRGRAIIENNDLTGNPHGAIQVTPKCEHFVSQKGNRT